MSSERVYGLVPGASAGRPYLAELNEAQRNAVLADAPRLLILAGAGTGKTRTLTARVARLVDDGVPPEAIILVTFSRRAAALMVQRIETLLGAPARRVQAGTFHALAFRSLARAGLRPSLLDEDDAHALMDRARGLAGVELPLSDGALLALHSSAINQGRSLAATLLARAPEAARHEAEIGAVLAHFQAEKAAMGLADYDDLLLGWRSLLGTEAGRAQRAQLQHVLVDEYQDTNPLQAELAEALAEGRALGVVGDDAQSIYGFRGARFDQILDFPRRSPTQVVALTTNYRSDPAILALANRSIAHNLQQFPKTLVSERRTRLLPARVPAPDGAVEARFVAQRALELVGEGLPLSEQAVLFRAHSHALELELELTRRGVPYQVRAGLRFFEQAHVRDLLAYLRVVANPRDRLAWSRILRQVPGVGAKTRARAEAALSQAPRADEALRALAETSEVPTRARVGLLALAECLGPWLAQAPSPHIMLQRLLSPSDPVGLLARVAGQSEASRRAQELQQLATLIDPGQDLLSFVSELLLEQSLGGQAEGAPAPGAERLTLTTVHQAKGLEWRAVFVIGLSEGAFPARNALLEPGGEAEERRLYYVAVTRAIDQLYLVHPSVRTTAGRETLLLRPSRFLEEVPDELYERWKLA